MPNLGQNILREIEIGREALPSALARIANFVLKDPAFVVQASVAELARQTESGEASILRFSRRMGFDSFTRFKIALATDLAYQTKADNRPSDLANRVDAAVRSTVDTTSPETLRNVAKELVAARHIDVFGAGVSGIVAELYAYRFSRLGLVSRAITDPVIGHEIIGSLREGSVLITISETGLTLETEGLLKSAKERGAYRLAISGRQIEELGKLCNQILIASPMLPPPQRGEVTPSVAKIVLCEMLAEAVKNLQ